MRLFYRRDKLTINFTNKEINKLNKYNKSHDWSAVVQYFTGSLLFVHPSLYSYAFITFI